MSKKCGFHRFENIVNGYSRGCLFYIRNLIRCLCLRQVPGGAPAAGGAAAVGHTVPSWPVRLFTVHLQDDWMKYTCQKLSMSSKSAIYFIITP